MNQLIYFRPLYQIAVVFKNEKVVVEKFGNDVELVAITPTNKLPIILTHYYLKVNNSFVPTRKIC